MNFMNANLARVCREIAETAKAVGKGTYDQRIHLTPYAGWLNDPNGLCQRDGVYHAYYQSSPFAVDGGLKFWAHATSRDLVEWEFDRVSIMPDVPADADGVYSGSAVVLDGDVHVFYTGNVKHVEEGRDFDYITEGRGHNTIHAMSPDGSEFGEKTVLLANADYPADVTCHVRDPKVWESDGETGHRWLMVLGARRAAKTRDEDRGEVLVYGSNDLTGGWELVNRIAGSERFGYMWECPDYFELPLADGAAYPVLSFSPQGLEGPEWEGTNVYQSGWVSVEGPVTGDCELGGFKLWDAGFDFYAPQTFEDEQGRRIMIGWMGMPDTPGHVNKTVDHGWQHCFTVPREIVAEQAADGSVRVLQRPVAELAERRVNGVTAENDLELDGRPVFDLEVTGIQDSWCDVRLADELDISFDEESGDVVMAFSDTSQEGVGGGRGERRYHVGGLESLRVIGDRSSVECFVNGGEIAFSTRYYPERYALEVDAPHASIDCWEL